MQISTKSRYGIRALYEIAKQTGSSPIKRKTISELQNIPDSYLENILVVMKNAGIIRTIRGARGGYVLIRKPEKVSMLDVVELLEGKQSQFACIEDLDACGASADCPNRDMWIELQQSMKNVLQRYTLKDLLDKAVTSETILYDI